MTHPVTAVIECQTCGRTIREMTPNEVKLAAISPHNFITDCRQCAKGWGHDF